jgi:hypothetical protein
MDPREIRWVEMDWVDLAERRAPVITVMNLHVPYKAGKLLNGVFSSSA